MAELTWCHGEKKERMNKTDQLNRNGTSSESKIRQNNYIYLILIETNSDNI